MLPKKQADATQSNGNAPSSIDIADVIAGGVFSSKRAPWSIPSAGSTARLQSFRSARDLSLGGAPKRLFKPKIPPRKKPDEIQPANEKESWNEKETAKKLPRKNRREEKKKRPARVTESTSGIFSAGPASSKSSRAVESRVGAGIGKAASRESNQRRDSKIRSIKREIGEDGHSGNDLSVTCSEDGLRDVDDMDLGDDCDWEGGNAFAGDDMMPVQLPLRFCGLEGDFLGKKGRKKAEEEMDLADDVLSKIKMEPNDSPVSSKVEKAKKDERSQKLQRKKVCFADILSMNESARDQCPFFQFPEGLLRDIGTDLSSSGQLGKLAIHKSGKVVLKVGGISFDLCEGSSCGFLQEVASVGISETESHLTTFGRVSHRIICLPNFGNG
eukprot:m.32263 g.32263  ORF g.32263 m.32263 type:complete len:385 (+) comp31609_c0_seq1:39-1193(+)